MTIEIDTLLRFASDKNPKFINNDRSKSIITLRHQKVDPASESSIDYLSGMLKGAGDELVELYRQTNGMLLFSNTEDPDESFYFIQIEDMEHHKIELTEWVSIGADDPDNEYGEDFEGDELTLYGVPPWWSTVVVFAGWGYAPERLFIPTDGDHVGEVFQFEHDGGYIVRVAMNLKELFSDIATQPISFIKRYYGVAYYDIAEYTTANTF
jgi:hypothetical protein